MSKKKIVHLTSVHNRLDNRIFLKELKALAASGFDATLIVADGKGDEEIQDIHIYDAGANNDRFSRILLSPFRLLAECRKRSAELYHIHDPELIPVGFILKASGNKVIFDSHEDYPADILTKPYLPKGFSKLISKLFSLFERLSFGHLDYIVCATPAIRNKFIRLGFDAIDINNYPRLSELSEKPDWKDSRHCVCYTGAITPIRGFAEIVTAMNQVNPEIRLTVAGKFSDSKIENRCKSNSGWTKVDDFGFVTRKEVWNIMNKSFAGLVTFLPAPNHIDSQPNKLFEYMAAGIPVIGSNFPLWREIIEGNNCGICVDPANPHEIAEAINYLAENQDIAKEMGKRGREAILRKYNWECEIPKLLRVYEKVFF